MNAKLTAAGDGTFTLEVTGIPASAFAAVKAPGPITPGQSRAYHAKAGDLALKRSEAPQAVKTEALSMASDRFNREITSSNDLDETEASWVLDWLDGELRKEAAHA